MSLRIRSDDVPPSGTAVTRRDFVQTATVSATAVALGDRLGGLAACRSRGATTATAVIAQIAAQHDATVKMLQDWIALPSIAAENRNYPQGPEYMAKLARDAGFDAGRGRADRRQVRRVRDARRRREDVARGLLHVRRQAVRSGGVELAAARGADRGPAGRREDHGRPRHDELEGAGDGVSRRAARVQGGRA